MTEQDTNVVQFPIRYADNAGEEFYAIANELADKFAAEVMARVKAGTTNPQLYGLAVLGLWDLLTQYLISGGYPLRLIRGDVTRLAREVAQKAKLHDQGPGPDAA